MSNEINLLDQETEQLFPENSLQDPSLSQLIDRVQEQQLETIPQTEQIQAIKVIEALLFASSDPLPKSKLLDILQEEFNVAPRQLNQWIAAIKEEYLKTERAFDLLENPDGIFLRTKELYAPYIQRLFHSKRTEKLSPAATEALAIIAYQQPVTRTQVDAIRGVDSSGTIANLVERQLISCIGNLDAPGRPRLYATTPQFLAYFGIQDLSELPK